MPLSISNSNSRVFKGSNKKQWFLSIVLLLVVICGSEAYLRTMGYRPSVKDTPELWSYWRNKCDKEVTKDIVVAIGVSRIQSGLVLQRFKDKVSCDSVIMLATPGDGGLPILKDIAYTSKFNGTVLCSVLPAHFSYMLEESSFANYYHNKFLCNSFTCLLNKIDLSCQTFLESHFVLFRFNSIIDYLKSVKDPSYSYMTRTVDRCTPSDFSLMSDGFLEKFKRQRVSRAFPSYCLANIEPVPKNRDLWMANISKAWKWASIIENRGGKVIFLQYPTSGEYRQLIQKYWPKEDFWDYAAKQSPIEMVHFLDLPNGKDFICPDTSHLNYDAAEIITELLADELIKRDIMQANE